MPPQWTGKTRGSASACATRRLDRRCDEAAAAVAVAAAAAAEFGALGEGAERGALTNRSWAR
eukprot:4949440-Pleurochrysis_carterae.AAC.1